MTCMLTGAIINTILDPLFIFGFHWGIKGAAWATVIGQIVSGIMVIVYFGRFRKMKLKKRDVPSVRKDFEEDHITGNGFLYQSDCYGCGTGHDE